MNLFALGVFCGVVTKLFVALKPPMWSAQFTVIVLWISAVGVLVLDGFLLTILASGHWTVYR
jgi:cytochrome c-type biogenesis protein CcmH/NrfF